MRYRLSPEMRRFLAYYLPPLAWATAIFALSAMPSLGNGTDYSVRMFLERKSAHVFEYTVLAGLLFLMFSAHAPKRPLESALLGVTVALLYAMSDEVHQLFVAGREGKITDVMIDSLGIILGTVIALWHHGALAGRNRGGKRPVSKKRSR